ncbi:phosphoribosylglycinamide formyltransferase [Vulcanimicrobium alpinum]|uniref:Phosphoribosylglycinamide formyltransferase n=1 Tax=Vulcanimicrobium alpinum TaxID=3016050 RepID=A0AAN1XY27_UNVUL|nr:MmcQ/YjbR family DNA-binding protein [Vulcanimicrobium alpinum]BDE07474.1 phosphoribosylglycinamide formyltransferase [Vulcanimicrobium alpinum]
MSARTAAAALRRVRALCTALPEVSERLSHGAPCFFVRDKSTFVMFLDDHHGDGRLALWCAAPTGAQEALIGADGERFFRPPYVGHRGWIGVRLDRTPDWPAISEIVEEAYRVVAPRTLLAALDAPKGSSQRNREHSSG